MSVFDNLFKLYGSVADEMLDFLSTSKPISSPFSLGDEKDSKDSAEHKDENCTKDK